ncbi:hypothetical protein ACUXV3_18890 [Roseobacteraceae bacterium NS-SX3]
MPQYNEMFALSVEDMDLIEMALRQTKASLAEAQQNSGDGGHEETLRQIHDLLGRLHNQKVFYYPKDRVYVSG